MESSSENEKLEIINAIVEPLLEKVFGKHLHLNKFVDESQEEYLGMVVNDLNAKAIINLWSDLQTFKQDFGSLSVELRNLQIALKRKIRSKMWRRRINQWNLNIS